MICRVHYSIRLQSSMDFDAPDRASAADAARNWLRRTYPDARSIEILRTEDREEDT